MSRGIAQILLTGFMVPLGFLVYICSFVISEDVMPYSTRGDSVFAGAVTWGVVILYWVLLWRKSVQWTVARIRNTILWSLAAPVGVTALLALLYYWAGYGRQSWRSEWGLNEFYLTGSVLTPMLWLIGTVLIWRESETERVNHLRAIAAGKVVCPNCSYNLAGLTEARCPECGSQYTLDQLVAAQPGAAEELSAANR